LRVAHKSKFRPPTSLRQDETPPPPIGHNSKWLNLPPDFNPIDATVDEVASWRRESRWTTHKKVREGVYESYLDGRIRKIIFASVKADRERAITTSRNPSGKRPVGRPRKHRSEDQTSQAG
jgi:hypothetical protein